VGGGVLCVGERPIVAHLEIDGMSVAVMGEGRKGFSVSAHAPLYPFENPKT